MVIMQSFAFRKGGASLTRSFLLIQAVLKNKDILLMRAYPIEPMDRGRQAIRRFTISKAKPELFIVGYFF